MTEKRSIRLLAFAVLIVCKLNGQSAPVVSTITTDANGSLILTIKNLGSTAITGYTYEGVEQETSATGQTKTAFVLGITDVAIFTRYKPIPPNQPGTETIRGHPSKVTFTSAVWMDGTTWGNPK